MLLDVGALGTLGASAVSFGKVRTGRSRFAGRGLSIPKTAAGAVEPLKISDNLRRAASWSLPTMGNVDAGVGFSSACIRSMAASVAASADDVFGI